jgi:hypothetical protein
MRGRRSRLEVDHPGLADAISRATANGHSYEEISAVSDIPVSTLQEWERLGKEDHSLWTRYFYIMITASREAFALKIRESCVGSTVTKIGKGRLPPTSRDYRADASFNGVI